MGQQFESPGQNACSHAAVQGAEQGQKRRPTPAPPAEGGWRKVVRWRAAPLRHRSTPLYKGGGWWCGAADGGRWRDPVTIPRRAFLYGNHAIRKFVSVSAAAGGTGKTALVVTEAL